MGGHDATPTQNTNLRHYCVKLLYTVIDLQLQELNNRFLEANTNLLVGGRDAIPNKI